MSRQGDAGADQRAQHGRSEPDAFMEERQMWKLEEEKLREVIEKQADKHSRYEGEKAQLEYRLEKLQERLQAAVEERERLEDHLEELGADETDDRQDQLVSALLDEKDLMSVWEEEKEEMEAEVARLREQNQDLTSVVQLAKAAIDEQAWAEEKESLKQALETEKAKSSVWEAETAELGMALEAAQPQLQAEREVTERLEEQLAATGRMQERLQLSERIVELTQQLAAAQEARIALQDELAQHAAEVGGGQAPEELQAALQQQLDDGRKRKDSRKQMLEALRQQVAEIRAKAAPCIGPGGGSQAVDAHLAEQLEVLRERVNEAEEKLQRSLGKEKESQETIATLRQKTATLRRQPSKREGGGGEEEAALEAAESLSKVPSAGALLRGLSQAVSGIGELFSGLAPIRTKSNAAALKLASTCPHNSEAVLRTGFATQLASEDPMAMTMPTLRIRAPRAPVRDIPLKAKAAALRSSASNSPEKVGAWGLGTDQHVT